MFIFCTIIIINMEIIIIVMKINICILVTSRLQVCSRQSLTTEHLQSISYV